MNMTYSVVSLFAGIGGLDLGFEAEGYEIAWANEISPEAAEAYGANFGRTPVCCDIHQLALRHIPKADVVIGGPPCQAFSLVGKRRLGDERGLLVYSFLRVVRYLKPAAFVMENVPGMSASRINGQRLPQQLSDEFERLGYTVTVMPLLATSYLVPQKRKRLFLVGCLNGRVDIPDPTAYALECHGVDQSAFDLSARAAIGDLGPCVGRGYAAAYQSGPHSQFSEMMRSRGGDSVSLHEHPRMSATDRLLVSHIPPGGNYTNVPDEVATARILKFKASGGRTTTYGRLHPERPAYTINTYFRRPNVGCNFHYDEDRLITPREAMRFQSLPDYFETRGTAQDRRNAQIGNAVPPLMARAVAWTLLKVLRSGGLRRPPRRHALQAPLPDIGALVHGCSRCLSRGRRFAHPVGGS